MLRKNPRGDFPQIDESAYIDKTAIICGKVFIEKNVFIAPYAVIRADELNEQGDMEPIIIKSDSNVQDGVVIHSKSGAKVIIGERTSIAHRSIVHGPCEVGNGVFLGFNSVVFNCKIGDGCIIQHNSVVDDCDLPAGLHVPSSTKVGKGFDLSSLSRVEASQADFSESVVQANHYLLTGYKEIESGF